MDYAALGLAFVAFDQSGEISAAAYGVPPFWVDTIQGAELWAVQMVIASMSLPEVLFTDCKTVQEGVRNTTQWAGSSKRRYAMIWTVLHTGLDEGSDAHRVVWMPAHTARERIGDARCGDGTVIDENMWCANQMADLLAKQGAAAVAYPRSVISTIEGQANQATLVVMYLGRLTLMPTSMPMRSSWMPVSIARAGSRRRLSKTVLTRMVSSGKVGPAARTTGKLALLTRPAVPSGEYQREAKGDPGTTSGPTSMPRNCTTALVSDAAGILSCAHTTARCDLLRLVVAARLAGWLSCTKGSRSRLLALGE
jgi:hypothetical protein